MRIRQEGIPVCLLKVVIAEGERTKEKSGRLEGKEPRTKTSIVTQAWYCIIERITSSGLVWAMGRSQGQSGSLSEVSARLLS